jgi:ergothioneine biosynthesis protein EgtB
MDPLAATTPLEDYQTVRRTTERLCAPLATEDYVVQAMPDASPTKWHLAHTAWFFETFVLRPHLAPYRPLVETYRSLFNSYYNSVGPQFPRPERGHLSRPTVDEVYAYRAHVDKAMAALLPRLDPALGAIVALGLHHEQQHQELIVTDLKYNLGVNPLRPAYHPAPARPGRAACELRFIPFSGGLVDIGHDGRGFAFDNEQPRHRTFLRPFHLACRPVTQGEYREFIEAGGYRRPDLWLSEGWRVVQERGWQAPLYWERGDGVWWIYTLAGMQPLDEPAPAVHLSYYEADAYARWRDQRLPTEQEWEHAAGVGPAAGTFLDDSIYQPVATGEDGPGLRQVLGDVWEWTQSPYAPYPGFRPLAGGLGEYNGKFMMNQMVLRGGSCATPRAHIRVTYRNFFPPDARWQFSGIRLAKDG